MLAWAQNLSLLAVLLCPVEYVHANNTDSPSTQPMSSSQIVSLIQPATVVVRSISASNTISTGTGFIVDSTGVIVTNYHVVADAQRIQIQVSSGDTYEVSGLRGVDKEKDIAILQIPGFDLPVAQLGNSNDIKVGDAVVVLGTALGVLDNTATSGIISAVRDLDGFKWFQMDAAISSGNSGGPVVNTEGKVVGITVAKLTKGESLNFAIPINYARGLLALDLKQNLSLLASGGPDESLFGTDSEGFPKRWKSLNSGTTKIIRRDGDRLYVETVLSAKSRARGAMTVAELKLSEDGVWRGTSRRRFPCTPGGGTWTRIRWKICTFEHPTNIYELGSNRIEGDAWSYPDNTKFNCRKCSFSKRGYADQFVWIPE